MKAVTRRYAKRMTPQDRRDQLLDVALDLVGEAGYRAVTVTAVAERADITRPVVYDLFGNSEELLAAMLAREEQRMQAVVASVMPALPLAAGADAVEVIGTAVREFLQAVRDNPSTWRLVYLPEEETPDSLRVHVEQARRALRGRVESLLRGFLGQTAEVDVALLAHIAQALIERSAVLVLTEPERYPPERVTRFVTDLLSEFGTP